MQNKIIVYGYLSTGTWAKRYRQDRIVLDPCGICTTLDTMQGGGHCQKVVIYVKNKPNA